MNAQASSIPPTSGAPAAAPAAKAVTVDRPRAVPAQVPVAKSNEQSSAPQRQLSEIMSAVAQQLESYVQKSGRELQFRVDSSTGSTVVSVLDRSGTLIRQIPSEEAMRLAERLSEASGTLVDITA